MRPQFYAALTEVPPPKKRVPTNVADYRQRALRKHIEQQIKHLALLDQSITFALNGSPHHSLQKLLDEREKTIAYLFEQMEDMDSCTCGEF